jgi:hypothetical protein
MKPFPRQPNLNIHQKLLAWFAGDDTGLSSKHMAAVAGGLKGNGRTPADPDDLGRCLRLVEAVPEVREHFPAIAASTEQWGAVITHWDELEALYRKESRGLRYFNAPKTYDRMKALGL